MSNLYLKEISPVDYPALAAYRQAYLNRQLVAHGCGDLENYDDMASWHQRQVAMTKRETLPEGYAPAKIWLVMEPSTQDGASDRLVGLSHLRLELTDYLRQFGGHVGYSIAPDCWGQGYGTQLLALTLDKARQEGLQRLLITCDQSNPGSARVIEKNGGVFENLVTEADGNLLCRYWIDL